MSQLKNGHTNHAIVSNGKARSAPKSKIDEIERSEELILQVPPMNLQTFHPQLRRTSSVVVAMLKFTLRALMKPAAVVDETFGDSLGSLVELAPRSVHYTPPNGNSKGTRSKNPKNIVIIEICTYENLLETAQYLLERIPVKPTVGIICGSGMGCLADDLVNSQEFPYETIPHFPVSTVQGHIGKLVFGTFHGVPVVCMQGRFHYYEGYPLRKCALPVRVMKLIGVTHLIASNAAGGLNSNYKVGDIMIVKDHINMMGFAGNNPLQGPNEERFGPRFPPMTKAYNKELREYARSLAQKLGIADKVHEGVYTCLGGPNYETVAELRMLKQVGADAVGMSTVHEVLLARHCDLTVFAFSLITNMCITDYDSHDNPNHEEVMDVGKMRQDVLKLFVKALVKHIADN